MKKSLKVSTFAMTYAMSASLIMTGCIDKNKPKDSKAVSIVENIDIRKVDNAEAERALSALGLDKSGNGALKWAGREGDKGSYTLKNITLKDGSESALTISEVKLLGVHMQDDQPNIDKIVIDDFTAQNDADKVKFDKITIARPSPALTASLAKLFSGDERAFNNISGDIGFQAVSLSDLDFKSDDDSLVLKSMSMGENKDKSGVFSLKGLSIADKGDNNISLSLASVDISGISPNRYKALFALINNGLGSEVSEKAFKEMFNSSNMFDPGFEHMSFKGFDGNFDGLLVRLADYKANTKKKGSKTIISQKMSPLTIKPADTITSREMKEFAKALADMGYSELEFAMGGKSILDEAADNMSSDDTWIEMKDGFRLSYDYNISGYKAMADKIAASTSKTANPMQQLEMMDSLKINSLKLAFKDNSIIDRGFKLAAAQKGGDPKMLKNQAKAGLAFLGMMAKDEAQQKLAGEIGEAVGKLLDNGGSLIIEMKPANPVSMKSIMGSGEPDIAALGISVKHQQ